MASSSPSTTATNWLIHASTKYQKSIYRTAEYKYRGTIRDLEEKLALAYGDIERLENEVCDALVKNEVLVNELNNMKLGIVNEPTEEAPVELITLKSPIALAPPEPPVILKIVKKRTRSKSPQLSIRESHAHVLVGTSNVLAPDPSFDQVKRSKRKK